MAAFYAAMHQIVGELIYADNFFIALYDAGRQPGPASRSTWTKWTRTSGPEFLGAFGEGNAAGATAYVLRTAALCYSLITG